MRKIGIDTYGLLERIRDTSPIVHHLTNWVTIFDCANIVKALGASPVMAHAKEEAAQMASIASSLVLNIGTLTPEFVQAMKIAAKSANKKGIPVVLDVCGAGATELRDRKAFELIKECKINIIKGNASEIARVSGEPVKTKGVDAGRVSKNMIKVAGGLAIKHKCTVVVTGKEDIVTDGKITYIIKNGHPMMAHVVGTGCMSTSVVGAFASVERDLPKASASALACFGIAAQCAAKKSHGPGSFRENIFDCIFNLDKKTIERMQRIEYK